MRYQYKEKLTAMSKFDLGSQFYRLLQNVCKDSELSKMTPYFLNQIVCFGPIIWKL